MIKTTSLETSKKLKEAGLRKECHFGYCNGELECNPSPTEWPIYAPTTDELLEELPNEYDGGSLGMTKTSVYYEIYEPYEPAYIKHCFDGECLVEALAKCWLWLQSQGLLTNGKEEK